MRYLAVWLVGAVFMFGMLLGCTADKPDAVCHSATEDSVITDCDYRDGAWYPKESR